MKAADKDRTTSRRQFLARCDLADTKLIPLGQDASFRRYFRLPTGQGTLLLMDAPPGQENVAAFTRVAQHLCALGLRAPHVHQTDAEHGFALLEDFGDDTFTTLISAGEDESELYALAIDVLTTLHAHPQAAAITMPPYDLGRLLDEALLLPDWYAPALTGKPTTAADREAYRRIWQKVIAALPPPATTLVLRDFHVDNLMRVPGEAGPRAIGLLDFQDAVIGPVAYDVVSLLEDARRNIDPGLVITMRRRYLEAMPLLDVDNFNAWYPILGAQRHCKVAGIFVRLAARDGKNIYLQHVPRVMRLLQENLTHPLLRELTEWLDERVPDRHGDVPEREIAALRQRLGTTEPTNP